MAGTVGDAMTDIARIESEETFRQVVEGAPVMLWMGNVQGRCVFLNRCLRQFHGLKKDIADLGWRDILYRPDLEKFTRAYAAAARKKGPFEFEARFVQFDGTVRLLQSRAEPRFSAAGEFLGFVGVNTDVTDLRQAEQGARLKEEQWHLALDASEVVGTWIWNTSPSRVITDQRLADAFVLDRVKAQTGVRPSALLRAVHASDRVALRHAVTEALRDGGDFHAEFRVTDREGYQRWLSATGRVELDKRGRATRFIGAAVDITIRRGLQDDMALLNRELSHRIKNIFAVVQGLIAVSARASDGKSAAVALAQLRQRISAMASAYDIVRPSEGGAATEAGSLRRLLELLFTPYEEKGTRLRMSGEDILLGPKSAASLALIFHEHVTNALKYGALSNVDGHVALEIEKSAEGYVLHWIEKNGPGVDGVPDAGGFGSLLIRSSVQSLSGAADFQWLPTGLRWRLEVPHDMLHY